MRLAELPLDDFRHRLAETGIQIRTGPFDVHLCSRVERFADQFLRFYGQFPLVLTPAIADFHVHLLRPRGLRCWWRPQVQFLLDGQTPFLPYPLSHAFPLFEWGLNWGIAMQAHQFLMLHSAAVERNGRVLLLPAWPGCGKSTLCAALVSRGWRLFSDEFGLLRHADGQLIPLPRPLPLKNRSIGVIRAFAPDVEIGPEFPGTRKGTVAHLRTPDSCVQQASVTAPPGWLVFPRYLAGASLRLQPIPKPQAFLKLANNSFNYQLLGLQGFQSVTRLVRNCDCYILSYSNLDEAVETMNRLADG
ncbi:MAG: HprK-related kinase A [Gammaproteobacteria bacterium]